MINYFADEFKPVVLCYFTMGTMLTICDVKIVEAMYTTKNKYFSKHQMTHNLTKPLTGNSILFQETSKEWKEARKIISPAFYKGKLLGMIELARANLK